MKLNLETDIEYNIKKSEIEYKIDMLIESSKRNLKNKISKRLKNEDENMINEVLKLIDEDLEEKRINIKKYFISQLEIITIEAFDEAMKKMME